MEDIVNVGSLKEELGLSQLLLYVILPGVPISLGITLVNAVDPDVPPELFIEIVYVTD